MADIFKEFGDLEGRLTRLKEKFETLQKDHTESQQKEFTALAQKSNDAMSALFAVAKLLDGNFNPLAPPPGFPEKLNDCVNAWSAAQDQATVNFDSVSRFSEVIVNFHDTEARDLQNALEAFRTKLELKVKGQEEERATRERTLHDQRMNLETCRRCYEELKEKKASADVAYKVAIAAAFMTVGIGMAAVLAAAAKVQQLQSLLGDASTEVRAAEELVQQAQTQVSQSEVEITHLQALIEREKELTKQVPDLLSRCRNLIQENETAQAEVAQVKTIRLGAMEFLAKCYNRAELSCFALSKANYGSSILQTVDIAMTDITLLGAARNIVDRLANNDDEQQSIHKITRPEHGDDNYLAFLLARLASTPSPNTEPSHYTVARAVASLGVSMMTPSKRLQANAMDSVQPAWSSLQYLEMKSALESIIL